MKSEQEKERSVAHKSATAPVPTVPGSNGVPRSTFVGEGIAQRTFRRDVIVQLDSAYLTAGLEQRVAGGWPTFEVTLTYHVETDDPKDGLAAVQAFFVSGDWPLDNEDLVKAMRAAALDGKRVRITNGDYSGRTGLVVEVDGDLLHVSMDAMDRPFDPGCSVTLWPSEVEEEETGPA